MNFVFLGIGLVLCVIFLSKRTAKVSLSVAFLKAVTSMCFILTGLFSFVANDNCPKIVGALVAVAAAWGLLGDIALDLKYVFKKYEEQYLNAGFSCFLVGHIFYCFAMYSVYGFMPKAYIIGVVIAALIMVFISFSEPLLKVKYGKFKPITMIYMAVLSFTTGLSVGYVNATDYDLFAVIIAVGFILFILSDAVLSGIYFSLDEKKRKKRSDIVLNHALYYAAQFTIGISLYFIKG